MRKLQEKYLYTEPCVEIAINSQTGPESKKGRVFYGETQPKEYKGKVSYIYKKVDYELSPSVKNEITGENGGDIVLRTYLFINRETQMY